MVNITIFIEGGILPDDKINVLTIDNSEKLRESFYLIFSQILSPIDFNISIKQGSGNKQTIKFFKSKVKKQDNSILLIDLDDFKDKKDNKLTEFDLKEYKNNVFFMVQEMEAWIISQIDKIDLHYKNKFFRKKKEVNLSNDNIIRGKHPESITKPSKVLKVILGRYFSYKSNKKRNKKYSKLRDGADLLAIINSNDLRNVFTDFEKLILKIEQTK